MIKMVKNLKLGTKVFVGYGLILLLLIITFTYQMINLNWFQTNFNKYSKISNDEMLAGRIQANLLESRVAYKNYVQFGDETQKVIFETRYNKMQDFIYELQSGINNAERENEINQIQEHATNYQQYFYKIVDYKDDRDELYNILMELGPKIETELTSIMDNAYYNGDIGLSHNTSLALKHLLIGRLNVAKFLVNNDMNLVDLANNEFTEMDELILRIKNSETSVQHQDLVNGISKEIADYVEYFNDIVKVIDERNQVINNMEEIGPEISNHAENIKLSIIEEQKSFTPKIKFESQMVLYRIIAISIIAIIVAIIITIRMTRFIVRPIKTVTNTFKEISEGEANLDIRINTDSKDELGEMAKSFNTFVCKLQIIMTQNKNQSWLKTGQAELNEAIRSIQDINDLSNKMISYVVQYLGCQIGAIFIENEDGNYSLTGTYAYHMLSNVSKVIVPGDGVIGQAIVDKQIRVVNDLPKDYISISSGLGKSVPNNIITVPCILKGSVKCVIEIGSFQEFTESQVEFLELIQESIALSVNSLESSIKLKNLLDKTIIQSEELQVQQEELRQSNEELEEQTRALRESEERLQAQQEELRVTNEELVERTKSLEIQKDELDKYNEHLLNAREEITEKANALEQTSKYKSEFLANMSHELRTPLNSILVLSQLLNNKKLNEPLTAKQIEFAGTIHSAGTDLLRLIDDILDMSKVEAGRLVINPEVVKLQDIADNAERVFRQIAIKKGLEFNINIDKDLPESIITDPLRIQQIMNNMLSNAFKFTEQGGVSLTINTAKDEELVHTELMNKATIGFRIKDTGIGVPEEKQHEIFEAFKQTDGTISRKYGGTGLGLYITKELAQLLGGTIGIKSQEGKGSTFILYLPVEQAITSEEDNKNNSIDTSKGIVIDNLNNKEIIEVGNNDSNKKTLLIIEDDNNFAHILSDLASEKNYHCFIAKDGRTGIELAKNKKPDAIILDIGLPDMNGLKVTEILGELKETKEIPIHLISGNELNVKENYKNGIIGYLQKPLSIEKIDGILQKFNHLLSKPFKKVLMVDGDVTQSQIVAELLEKNDMVVRYVDTGKKVFDLINREEFDCIILDLKLSDMSGFDLLAKLRDGVSHQTPVIIYTENELTKEEEEQLKHQAECIIIKGSRSVDRLVDEVNLFLHDLNKYPVDKSKDFVETTIDNNDILMNKKILVVDDDMRNVFALSGILEDRGIKVVVGRNGKDGIDKLHQNTDTDLVLMDIMMPEMDGYQAIKEIRKENKYKNLPIIALTAKSMKEDRQKCIEAGANEYMTKPIDVEKLLSILRVWLHK